jgi:hypothetical protein
MQSAIQRHQRDWRTNSLSGLVVEEFARQPENVAG